MEEREEADKVQEYLVKLKNQEPNNTIYYRLTHSAAFVATLLRRAKKLGIIQISISRSKCINDIV